MERPYDEQLAITGLSQVLGLFDESSLTEDEAVLIAKCLNLNDDNAHPALRIASYIASRGQLGNQEGTIETILQVVSISRGTNEGFPIVQSAEA